LLDLAECVLSHASIGVALGPVDDVAEALLVEWCCDDGCDDCDGPDFDVDRLVAAAALVLAVAVIFFNRAAAFWELDLPLLLLLGWVAGAAPPSLSSSSLLLLSSSSLLAKAPLGISSLLSALSSRSAAMPKSFSPVS
jgi:hypothetical protein